MERFLRYSYEKQRPIRLMLMISGSLKQVTATVTQRTDEAITLDCRRPKKTLTLRPEDILAADYIKKDEGLEP
ncbi:MAG: hypothetical protein IKP40_06470 [Clostridia bacterium]|nr:hypothetical protein [Clostridia bacterium]